MVPGNNQAILTLSPNPVISTLHVQLLSAFTEPVTIKVFNNTGIAVLTFTKNAVLGTNVWDFNLGNYSVCVKIRYYGRKSALRGKLVMRKGNNPDRG